MAKQVVWVFGASAAGKATFINYVSKNRPQELLARMGWRGAVIAAEPNSLSLVGQTSYHDSSTRKRSIILSSVKTLLESSDVVLIKGQQVDIDTGRPQRLQSECPGCKHRIIYLDAGAEKTLQRMKQKPWWKDSITTADVETWRYSQLDTVRNMPGFKPQFLDSSKDFVYGSIARSDSTSADN